MSCSPKLPFRVKIVNFVRSILERYLFSKKCVFTQGTRFGCSQLQSFTTVHHVTVGEQRQQQKEGLSV